MGVSALYYVYIVLNDHQLEFKYLLQGVSVIVFFSVYIFGFSASPATQIYRKFFAKEQKEEFQQEQEMMLDEIEKKYELVAANFREKIRAINLELIYKYITKRSTNPPIDMEPL